MIYKDQLLEGVGSDVIITDFKVSFKGIVLKFDIVESTGFNVNGNTLNLTANFNIDQFINAVHQVDLTLATNGNQDGLIAVNTNDKDGNKELVDLMKENIKASADLIR
ncbi:hypothetical protein QQ008_21100 [Fulvivirgaceae bacterium BMA10]|uniref:Uncharacterized protein n=1 Tax=Splendidivirga corallicola TaxID=3051826 RepID=A0ABT8KUU4_9BACT|nr:hypothetical protein [Fulvivirgaceae bacterium BMA10]